MMLACPNSCMYSTDRVCTSSQGFALYGASKELTRGADAGRRAASFINAVMAYSLQGGDRSGFLRCATIQQA